MNNKEGYFGNFGGRFVPEALRPPLMELEQAMDTIMQSPAYRDALQDLLVNYAGELVLVRNRLLSLAARLGDESLATAAGELDRVTDDLQGAVMGMRMQPVGRLFQRFPRIVRDLARQLGKDVELVLEGEGTDLDRGLVEALADPLIHLLRNALDHGVEMPADREQAGKPR